MKLLFCPRCFDVITLRINKISHCECGLCSGGYINSVECIHHNGIIIGLDNFSLKFALEKAKEGKGEKIICWTYPTPKDYEYLDIDYGFLWRRTLGVLFDVKTKRRSWWLIKLTLWLLGITTFNPTDSTEVISRKQEKIIRKNLKKVRPIIVEDVESYEISLQEK